MRFLFRAVPEIILGGGWAAGTFLSCGGGGCFVNNVSEEWAVTCPGGQGVFDPSRGGLVKAPTSPGGWRALTPYVCPGGGGV